MKNNYIVLVSLLLLSCNQSKVNDNYTLDHFNDSLVITEEFQETLPQETAEEIKILEEKAEKTRLEKELLDRYGENSLSTGSLPYAEYYGRNKNCDSKGCSKIVVTTSNSDVIVTIKENEQVVRHSYIKAGDSYTFSFPNGTYQTFFYYGKGWNPEKPMKDGELKGGFTSNESVGKDNAQYLSNNILEYHLVLQQNGNFSTQPSNLEEAL